MMQTTRAERRGRETRSEGIGVAGAVGAIGQVVNRIPFIDRFKNYFLQMIIGGIVTLIIKNAEEISEKFKELMDEVKKVLDLLNEYVIQPLFKMVKAIVGPIVKEIAKMTGLPDFAAEENTILQNLKSIEDNTGIIKKSFDKVKEVMAGIKIPGFERRAPGAPQTTQSLPDGQPVPPSMRPPGTSQQPGTTQQPRPGTTQQPGGSQPTPPSQRPPGGGGQGGGQWQPILELIAKHEAVNGSYDSIYPSTTKQRYSGGPPLTKMTIAEADKWQEQTYRQRGSAAAGRYQFMYIKDQAAAAGIKPNEMFDEANQDKMAVSLITKTRGITWEMVKNNPNEAMIRLGMEWASLPMPVAMQGASRYVQAGQSYYAGDGLNKAGASVAEVRAAFGAAQQQAQIGSRTSQPQVQPQTPMMGDAYSTGLKTGPPQYIGGSSEYHIDTKIKADIPMSQAVAMVDSMAKAYEKVGREIEFSNQAVAGEIYNHNAPYNQKAALLERVFGAHAPRGGWRSMDYYIPLKGKGRFDKSSEGAEIITPTIPGGQVEFHQGGRYGAFVVVTDANGNVISKTGHGDIRGARSGTVQIPRTNNTQSNGVSRQTPYERRPNTTIVIPPQQSHGSGASGMMSGPRRSGGGGNSRASTTHTYLRASMRDKLYKMA